MGAGILCASLQFLCKCAVILSERFIVNKHAELSGDPTREVVLNSPCMRQIWGF